ncbi:hypothetical protein BH09VER1_BH09VER1_45090 [soil metagenome]
MDKKSVTGALTLVELLATLAIVITLAALSAAGIANATKKAQVTKCLGNLRAIGQASTLFSAENDGRLPQSTHQGPALAWQYTLPPYLEGPDKKVFVSPLAADPRQSISYSINDFLTSHPYGAPTLDYSRRQCVSTPTATLLFTLSSKEHGGADHFHFADGEEGGYSPSGFASEVQVDVLNGAGHYLFVDGHVERISWKILTNELNRPGSKFIDPTGHH